jgi:heterodisulfide reductase subunit A
MEKATQHNPDQNGKVGAVLIVGGGISGMQAALDMADSGFKVYLVDEKSSIGGVMAQLDKTFPTNDCSTCMISPKLIEVSSNPNIEIITLADIEGISGEPGKFKVKVRKRARYVNMDLCTGCGACVENCPVVQHVAVS